VLSTQPACIAVIPARAGSKRIPRKNVREFLSRPLIAHTIEAAVESALFTRVIVSTEDPQIAEISRNWGAEVPFIRDVSLADDFTDSSKVTADVLEKVDPDGHLYSYIAQLLPTCPLRNAADVRNSFQQMVTTAAVAQLSVTRFVWMNPWWAFRRDPQWQLSPVFPEALKTRSQDLQPLFGVVGAIWWAKSADLRKHRSFYVPGYTGWEIPWERGLDIDTEDDWKMALFIRDSQFQAARAQ
jgi:CMP-N-acetylneuraminic acid synthetase